MFPVRGSPPRHRLGPLRARARASNLPCRDPPVASVRVPGRPRSGRFGNRSEYLAPRRMQPRARLIGRSDSRCETARESAIRKLLRIQNRSSGKPPQLARTASHDRLLRSVSQPVRKRLKCQWHAVHVSERTKRSGTAACPDYLSASSDAGANSLYQSAHSDLLPLPQRCSLPSSEGRSSDTHSA